MAAALDIHPFMLWKWRKQVREGVRRGPAREVRVPPLREIRRPRAAVVQRRDLLAQDRGARAGDPRLGVILALQLAQKRARVTRLIREQQAELGAG